MKELLARLYEAAHEPNLEAICIGPETYYALMKESVSTGISPVSLPRPGEWVQVFGERVAVIPGIPENEIVVSSYPYTAFTGLRSILTSAKEK